MNSIYDPGRGSWIDYDTEPYGSVIPVATSVIHDVSDPAGATAVPSQSPSLNQLNSSSEAPVILSLDEHSNVNHDQIRWVIFSLIFVKYCREDVYVFVC
jgi:hypothetical protein